MDPGYGTAVVRARAKLHGENGEEIPIIRDQANNAGSCSGSLTQQTFYLPRTAQWDLTFGAWDGSGHGASTGVTFWSASPAGVGPGSSYFPSLRCGPGVPNPATGWVRWNVDKAKSGPAQVDILSVDGRCVRTWRNAQMPGGRTELYWDGLDGAGRPVSAGRYFVRIIANGTTAISAVAIVR